VRKIFAAYVSLVVSVSIGQFLFHWISTSPWYVSVGTFGSTFLLAFLLIWWKKKNQAKRDAAEALIVERIASDVEFAANWLQNLHVHYYDPEKACFLHWLMLDSRLPTFRFWNDALRLQRMGEETGRFYICHLDYMTENQKKARMEVAWNRKRKEQSLRDRQRNVELKALRRTPQAILDVMAEA